MPRISKNIIPPKQQGSPESKKKSLKEKKSIGIRLQTYELLDTYCNKNRMTIIGIASDAIEEYLGKKLQKSEKSS